MLLYSFYNGNSQIVNLEEPIIDLGMQYPNTIRMFILHMNILSIIFSSLPYFFIKLRSQGAVMFYTVNEGVWGFWLILPTLLNLLQVPFRVGLILNLFAQTNQSNDLNRDRLISMINSYGWKVSTFLAISTYIWTLLAFIALLFNGLRGNQIKLKKEIVTIIIISVVRLVGSFLCLTRYFSLRMEISFDGTPRLKSEKNFDKSDFIKLQSITIMEEVECAICIEAIKTSTIVKQLSNCNHLFHQECLEKWL